MSGVVGRAGGVSGRVVVVMLAMVQVVVPVTMKVMTMERRREIMVELL